MILIQVFFLFMVCATLLLCNVLQLFSVVFLPISENLVRNLNRELCKGWFAFLVYVLTKISRAEILISGDTPASASENAFIVMNHQAMADIPLFLTFARRHHRQQDTKWFLKDSLKWIPGVGWGMLFLDQLFVKRNWADDKERILSVFARLRKHQQQFWIISYVEGTRLTPPKLLKTQEIAMQKQIYRPKYTLLPRTRGFTATIEGVKSQLDAVYDITIGYEGHAPSLFSLFLKPQTCYLHIRRFAVGSLPAEAENQAKWILSRFQEKDQALGIFYAQRGKKSLSAAFAQVLS